MHHPLIIAFFCPSFIVVDSFSRFGSPPHSMRFTLWLASCKCGATLVGRHMMMRIRKCSWNWNVSKDLHLVWNTKSGFYFFGIVIVYTRYCSGIIYWKSETCYACGEAKVFSAEHFQIQIQIIIYFYNLRNFHSLLKWIWIYVKARLCPSLYARTVQCNLHVLPRLRGVVTLYGCNPPQTFLVPVVTWFFI